MHLDCIEYDDMIAHFCQGQKHVANRTSHENTDNLWPQKRIQIYK